MAYAPTGAKGIYIFTRVAECKSWNVAKVAACDRGVGWTMERSYAPTGPTMMMVMMMTQLLITRRSLRKNLKLLARSRFSVFPLTIEQSRLLSGSL